MSKLIGRMANASYLGNNPDFDHGTPPNFSNTRMIKISVRGEIVATSFDDCGLLFIYVLCQDGSIRKCAYGDMTVDVPTGGHVVSVLTD